MTAPYFMTVISKLFIKMCRWLKNKLLKNLDDDDFLLILYIFIAFAIFAVGIFHSVGV